MINCRKMFIPLILLLASGLLSFSPSTSAQNIVTGKNNSEVLQLGKIKVEGEPMILKVLQIIKQGLQEPYSNDPKLANVVVCRLNEEAGSHLTSTLLCATNRVFSEGRDAVHLAGANAHASESDATCSGTACATLQDQQIFAAMNEALDSLPGHYLHASVNGAALHKLLEKIPNPKNGSAPAATTHRQPSKK
ncbi:MAG: hypothetical protein WCC11_11920 [Gammaproteobacteria bacterium]